MGVENKLLGRGLCSPSTFLVVNRLVLTGCALGADTYWLAAAHIYTPLPLLSGKEGFSRFFRTHFFVNAGNLTNIDLRKFYINKEHDLEQLFYLCLQITKLR